MASLFGDVNEIEIDGKIQIIYSHQLEVVAKSDLKVEVVKAYFLGSHYLIEGNHIDSKIFFESPNEIQVGSKIYLKKKP